MEIIGLKWLKFDQNKRLVKGKNFFDFDEKAIAALEGDFSLKCKSVNEILLANAAGAKYLIIDKSNDELIKKAVNLAEFYMFDSKIACIIPDISMLEKMANLGVDAVFIGENLD